MPNHGFIVNDAEVAGIQAAFTSSLLHEDVAIDAKSANGELPSSCLLDHLDVIVDVTAGAVTAVECKLTWDAAGDDLIAPLASLTTAAGTLIAGQTDVSLLLGVSPLARWVRAPATQTTSGKVYLWIRASAGGGTMTLKIARLHWTDRATSR